MHRVLKSHLDSFAKDSGVESESLSSQFEKFCNVALIQPRVSSKIDLDDVTTGEDDDGIDGVAVVINEEIIIGKEDAELIFASDRRNNDVELVFVQAKTSEGYDLGDFLKFKEAILRFVSQDPYAADSPVQQEARSSFDVVVNNVAKIRGGKPSVTAVFATAGVYQAQKPQETARVDAEAQIKSLGYFSDVNIKYVGRDELIAAWVSSYSGIEVSLQMHSHAGLPQISGIEESYLAVVRAKDFIEQVLTSSDGTIRSQLFEDNVRHYLGSSNPVNASIRDTVRDSDIRTRFPVLNNGVTIVSPDVVVQSNRMLIRNFQIVNGCQTSHVLYENRDSISEDVMMTLKVVETEDEDVFSELVRATNSQSQVAENQFLSLSPMARKIEQYFNTFEGQEGRLYFERRVRQYAGRGVPGLRIIDLDTAARAFCSMYLRRPDLAFKYPKSMYEQLTAAIFDAGNKESLYYASSLVVYRIHVLTSSGSVASSVRKYKWHILPIVSAIVAGKSVPRLNSKQADAYAKKIVDVFQVQNDRINEVLNQAVDVIQSVGEITNDRLKRQAALDEMLERLP